MSTPSFLAHNARFRPPPRLNETTELYRPLLGSWLIKLALMLHWYEPDPNGCCPALFNREFATVTGIFGDDENPRTSRRPTAAHLKKVLTARLQDLEEEELSSDLPLFANLNLFAELLDLSEAEQALLLFVALFDLFMPFREAVEDRGERISDHQLWRILSNLTGIAESQFRLATRSDGILVSAGLISVDHTMENIASKVDLMEGLCGVLLVPHSDVDELMGRFLRRAQPASLTLDNFPHLSPDTAALREYLGMVLQKDTTGVNILLAGKAGVGKTEYAQALAADLGAELYEIDYSSPDGEPIRGTSRLRAYSFCQRLLGRKRNALLMFDEIEDVFPSDHGFLSFLFGDCEKEGKVSAGKAWINRTMEQNRVPALWISNRTDQIDHAYLRRFDYSVIFPIPPRQVRLTIARHHLGCFDPDIDWLEWITANEQLTPGQLERAAKVAAVAAGENRDRALELAHQTLQRSMALLDQPRVPSWNRIRTGYKLVWLNTDTDVAPLLAGLKRRPQGTFCFFGASGTGKSELARHIADELGRPIVVRRASDLLGMYLGESEKRIAAMFEEARRQEAVLVLDEADSFLSDRRGAQRSWEMTQVNELLTQMEAFEGIFVCTTNLMERLDQASLRRFSFKIRFDPLTPDQRWGLFQQELARLGGSNANLQRWEREVRRLEGVTPGDFAVAARQFELLGESVSAAELFAQLQRECRAKEGSAAKIGFIR